MNLVRCDNTLREVQGSLRKYLKRIDAVARDIGVLQAKLRTRPPSSPTRCMMASAVGPPRT